MKTAKWIQGWLGLIAFAIFGFAAPLGAEDSDSKPTFEVHEWGTFTTLHWPSGAGLSWYQNTYGEVSELPAFVHGLRVVGKSRAWGPHTARMETPVLYFYTDEKQVIDLEVEYPGGMLTEFYPKTWKQLELIPPGEAGELARQLPVDPERPDNHYFEARAVPDAAFVRSAVPPGKDGKPRPDELERFVFYRGVGTFNTQLYTNLDDAGQLTLKHYNHDYGIDHVWVVYSSAEAVRWTKLPAFAPYDTEKREPATASVRLNHLDTGGSRDDSIAALKSSMIGGLTEAGLTSDEATAMVATWDSHWYEEPGQRVFSIPPQKAIDPVLPLKISPKPAEVVRVFVHRQELLQSKTLKQIETALSPATDPQIARKMIADAQLGRFVHGAIGAVADDVSRRTRQAYYSRGLAAIKPEEEWIDLGSEGSELFLSADFHPPEKAGHAELIFATEKDEERCRIGLSEKGRTSLWLFDHQTEGPAIDLAQAQSILLRIVSRKDAPDEVFLNVAIPTEAATVPQSEADWTLINRGGHSNADLRKIKVRGPEPSPFRNIRVSRTLAGLASSPVVEAESVKPDEADVVAARP